MARMETPSPSPLRFDPSSPVINVIVNPGTRDVVVIPTVVHLKVGQTVSWALWVGEGDKVARSADACCLLTFRDVNAVDKNEIRGGPGKAASAKTRKPGRYHYKVMVAVGGVIYADVGCPSVTIER